ncbi:MAG: hypothetical protein K0R57_4566 [Paenibacillaceae bacterium]|nr:hypothetical protein [Paenibacillaceae bacterium]
MRALYFPTVEETYRFFQEEHQEHSHAAVLFSSASQVQELSKHVPADTVLCSTAGEYTCQGYKDGAVTGFIYEKSGVEIIEIDHPPILSSIRLKQAYRKVKDNENAFMLLLCDGLGGMEESIMNTFYFMDPGFKIIGGSAGDNLQFKETYLYIGKRRVLNLALFFNCPSRTALVKENIYVRTGTTLLVTGADALNRVVTSFNNQPAAEEYARVLGVAEKELPQHFMNHPLGKAYEDDIFIASPMKVNPDKSITFYSELMSNTFVHVLKPTNPIQTVRNTVKNVPFKPSFVLSINCILRSLMFLQEGYWNEFDSELLQLCKNVTGFVSYGEQYYQKHANQTMVMLLAE